MTAGQGSTPSAQQTYCSLTPNATAPQSPHWGFTVHLFALARTGPWFCGALCEETASAPLRFKPHLPVSTTAPVSSSLPVTPSGCNKSLSPLRHGLHWVGGCRCRIRNFSYGNTVAEVDVSCSDLPPILMAQDQRPRLPRRLCYRRSLWWSFGVNGERVQGSKSIPDKSIPNRRYGG